MTTTDTTATMVRRLTTSCGKTSLGNPNFEYRSQTKRAMIMLNKLVPRSHKNSVIETNVEKKRANTTASISIRMTRHQAKSDLDAKSGMLMAEKKMKQITKVTTPVAIRVERGIRNSFDCEGTGRLYTNLKFLI